MRRQRAAARDCEDFRVNRGVPDPIWIVIWGVTAFVVTAAAILVAAYVF